MARRQTSQVARHTLRPSVGPWHGSWSTWLVVEPRLLPLFEPRLLLMVDSFCSVKAVSALCCSSSVVDLSSWFSRRSATELDGAPWEAIWIRWRSFVMRRVAPRAVAVVFVVAFGAARCSVHYHRRYC